MKQIHWWISGALFVVLLFMFMDSLSYLFVYHEEQQLFLFTRAYAARYFSEPGLLGEYIANFVTQFFHLFVGGKMILAFMYVCLYLFPVLTARKWNGGNSDPFHVALLLPLYLFIRFEASNFQMAWVTSLFICFLILFLLSRLPRRAFYLLSVPFLLAAGIGLGWMYPVVAAGVVLCSVVLSYLGGRLLKKERLYKGLQLLMLGIYAVVTFQQFVISYRTRERLLVEAEQALRKKDWEKVIDCSNRFRGDSQLMDYFRNMALYQTGRMSNDLLKYPQRYGIHSLFLPWVGDPRQSRYGHYVYEQLGYLNEAQRWASEALVVYGATAPTLLNLIRYNIANGRTDVAMRFIRRLKQSLFYRKQAEAYERLIQSGQPVPDLHVVPPSKSGRARFANVQDLGPELLFICEQDPTNRMAFEYLMIYSILSKNCTLFAENIGRIEYFSYPEMPPLYRTFLEQCEQLKP